MHNIAVDNMQVASSNCKVCVGHRIILFTSILFYIFLEEITSQHVNDNDYSMDLREACAHTSKFFQYKKSGVFFSKVRG